MKKNILLTCSVMMALCITMLTSCSDAEEMKDLDLPRVLMPYNLSAVADQMEPAITVSWDGTSNAESYILEAFLDDPDFEGEPVASIQTTETECLLEDLFGETMYNIRVKGVAEGKEDSKWAVINRATAAEQILSAPFKGIEETSVRLTWPARKEVNAYKVLLDGEVVKSGAIDERVAAMGSLIVDGLTGGTKYTFEVYLNDKRRGYIDETTEIGAPVCDYTINLAPTDNIQTKLDEMAEGKTGSYSVAVMLQAGETYNFYKVGDSKPKDVFMIPNGMSVTFYGDKNNAPTIIIDCDQMKVDGDHDVIAFQKVKLQGAKYFMNQSGACNVGKLEFTLCDISGFKGNTFVRTQGNNNPTFGKIEVNKCTISNCANNYSIFDLRKAKVTDMTIKYSTVMNSATNGKNLVQADATLKNLTINACTFFNICGNAQALLNLNTTGENVNIENCLFAKSADTDATKSKVGGTLVVTNSYNTKDWYKPLDGLTALDVDMTGLFLDPESGNFNVNDTYVELGAGDPRWLP